MAPEMCEACIARYCFSASEQAKWYISNLRMRSPLNAWLKRQALRIVCGLLLVLLHIPAQAAPGGPNSSKFQYTRALWRVPDGLPEETVQALAESSDGRLWIGTTGGLARFDGAAIEVRDLGNARSVTASSIFCLTFAHDGSLWAGTEGGGLLRLHGTEARVYSAAEGLTDGFVRSVYEDDRSRLWVGTDDGLFVLEGNRLRRVDAGPALAPIAVHSITEDSEHRIWVGGSRLISIDPDGQVHELALPGEYSQNRVKRILQTRDGAVWVGTVGGLQYFKDNHFHPVDGIHATVRSLLETADGTLWIGTIGDGLWTLRDGRLNQLSIPGLLPSDTVLSILQDKQQQIWIGTQAGLVRLNKTPVSVIVLPEGGDPDFETISGDDRGNIWVAAQRLYNVRNGVAAPVVYGNLGNVSVRNVYRARDGALWIGTDGSGAYRLDDRAVTHYTAPGELTNNFIRGFMESRDGTMWIATDEGLSRIGRDDARKLTEADGLAFFSTRSLLEARDGSLWVGTDHGLSRWKNGRFQQDDVTRSLRQEKIWSILEDRRGALWFGTRDHGLYRWRGGRLDQFTSLEGLPSNSVYQILQDRTGTFWLTGPNTIASLPEAEMEQDHPSPERPLSVEVYSMPFGAEGAQLYGGRQPSGYLAPDDSVWFPTNRGVAHILHADDERQPPPRLSIESVLEDGRTIVPNGRVVVPSHVVRLSFPFTAISLRSQQGVRFRYKLENFDRNWNVLTGVSAADRVATYTNLRAGHYRFRVQAFNTADPGIVTEADLPFSKSPAFYEAWWFYLLCVLVLVAAAWSVYQIRVRQIRARFEAVLAERSRLAREMHDTVIQGCTGISALLEAVASTPEDHGSAKHELLDYARTQARTTIKEAREAIWNMRHEGEKDIELTEALSGVAAQTTREFGTAVKVEHNLSRVPVAASVAHEILMVVREAVNNSVQHGRTDSLTIQLLGNEDSFSIAVVDAGCGFSLNGTDGAQEGHYGIVGMRERMQRLGGQLELTSSPGAGTTVRLLVRRRQAGTKARELT
jgi:ligand-binding sensor domain-containing protein/signal transduction histidine kinase